MTQDVTKPNTPVPPTATVPRPMAKVEPPKTVSGFGAVGVSSQGPGETGAVKSFKLPETVTPAEVQRDSFRYGGGRTAGGGTPGAPVRKGRNE